MESGDIKIVLGDCLDVLPTLAGLGIDAIVTDPPYGVSLEKSSGSGGKHGLVRKGYDDFEDSYENFLAAVVPSLSLALGIVKRGAVFSGPHLQEQPKAEAIGGVYCPAGAGRHAWGFKTFHPVLFYGKDHTLNKGARPNTLVSNAAAEKNGHPCPKPLEWMIWAVERVTKPGELVIDPFMGSGTTAVACIKTGRRFIGIERNARYFAIAKRRIERSRMSLFAEPIAPPPDSAPLFAEAP